MAWNKVEVFFEDQSDALQFTLAASSVLSGEDASKLTQSLSRAARVTTSDSATSVAAEAS